MQVNERSAEGSVEMGSQQFKLLLLAVYFFVPNKSRLRTVLDDRLLLVKKNLNEIISAQHQQLWIIWIKKLLGPSNFDQEKRKRVSVYFSSIL